MSRPTALIRRLLVLESLQEYMAHEISQVKAQMRNDGIKIIDRKVNLQDIWIQYRYESHYDEAIYMRKMLDAETRNRAKRSGLLS